VVNAQDLCYYPHLTSEGAKATALMQHVVKQTVKLLGERDLEMVSNKERKRQELELQIAKDQENEPALGRPDPARLRRANQLVGAAQGIVQPQTTLQTGFAPPSAYSMIELARALVCELKLEFVQTPNLMLGGFGGVFAVRHPALPQQTMALKISKRRLEGNQDRHCDSSQIKREYRHLTLCHSVPEVVKLGTVPCFSHGLAHRHDRDGVLEYVGIFMTWIPSVSLEHAAQQPEWISRQAHRCILALARGVFSIHSLFLIHADIKLDNIMIHHDLSSVTIVDLGNATAANCGLSSYGTAGYRAPELAGLDTERKVNVYARALETWAVGVTALQFACGVKDLCVRLEGDQLGDRSVRQDKELAGKASAAVKEAGLWAKQFAVERVGTEHVIRDDGKVFGFIDAALSVDLRIRAGALNNFVKSVKP
jgi:hypothetical protein